MSVSRTNGGVMDVIGRHRRDCGQRYNLYAHTLPKLVASKKIRTYSADR